MKGNSRSGAVRRPRKQELFLAALTDTVNVTLACRRAGIPRRTAYDWRDADAAFAQQWDEALDEGVDLLEAELHRRAFEGVERPVYYKGEQVDTWRFYSDALAMFLLRAHRPERYRGTPARHASGDVQASGDAQASGDGQIEELDEKEAEVRAYRAMFEKVWAENREKQDRELAAQRSGAHSLIPPVPAGPGQ